MMVCVHVLQVIERVLFYLVPVPMVTTVSWIGGMLFGRYAVALIVSLTG